MHDAHRQRRSRLRLDWGPAGARAVTSGAAVTVVVDALSFTTAVTVAVERGTAVLPWGGTVAGARALAEREDAQVAEHRAAAGPRGVSLSPASLRRAALPPRLVLPSPNGSAICAALAGSGTTVAAGCLRNAAAVAAWVVDRAGPGGVVAVVAAGERWPDGSLRPCAEDLWGAGAVVAALLDAGWDGASPEAAAAAAAFRAVGEDPLEHLLACASGAELVASGWAEDVAVAAELRASSAVPVLEPAPGSAFTDAGPTGAGRPLSG